MATKSFSKRALSIINSHKIRLGEDFDRGDKPALEAMNQELEALQQEQLQAQEIKKAKDYQFQQDSIKQFQDGGRLNRRQQTSISQLLQQSQQPQQQGILPQQFQNVGIPQGIPQQQFQPQFRSGGRLPQYQDGSPTRLQGATVYGQSPANDPNLELEFWMTQPFGERPKWLQKLTRGITNIAELNKPYRAAARQKIMDEIVAKRETIQDVAKKGTTAQAQVPIASDSQIDANKYLNFTQNLINDRSPLSPEEQAAVANAPQRPTGQGRPGYAGGPLSTSPVFYPERGQQQAQGIDATTGATIPAQQPNNVYQGGEIPGVTVTGQRPVAPTATPVGTGVGGGGQAQGQVQAGNVAPGRINPGDIYRNNQLGQDAGLGFTPDSLPQTRAGAVAQTGGGVDQQQGFDTYKSRVPWYGAAAQGLGSILANRQLDLGALEGVEDVQAQRIAPRLVDYSRSREQIQRERDRAQAMIRQGAKQRGTQQGLTQSTLAGATETQRIAGIGTTASQEGEANKNQEIIQGADIFNAQQESLADRTNLGIAMQRSQLERQNALINADRRSAQISGVAGAIQGYGRDVFSAGQYDQMINLGTAGKDFGFSQQDPTFARRFFGVSDPAQMQFNNPNLRISG